jgi:hypothetical protein
MSGIGVAHIRFCSLEFDGLSRICRVANKLLGDQTSPVLRPDRFGVLP